MNSGPKSATRTKKSTMQMPGVALRLRVKIRHSISQLPASGNERRHCTGAFFSSRWAPEEGTTASASEVESADGISLPDGCGNILTLNGSLLLAHARIKYNIDQVSDKIGAKYSHGDQQKNPLQQRVVGVLRRLQEGKTNARIGEDYLGEQRTTDDKAQGEGKTGHIGQNCIAGRIGKHHATLAQPLR